MKHRHVLPLVLCVSCSHRPSSSGDGSDSGDVTSSSSADSSGVVSTASTTGATSGGSTGGMACTPEPPAGGECDPWCQDCVEGQKCVPVWTEEGGFWSSTRCMPVGENAGGPGEPCTVDGTYGVDPDDCTKGAICMLLDGENTGFCVELCTGDRQDPTCGPKTRCVVESDSTLAACLEVCDPGKACAQGGDYACYAVSSSFPMDETDTLACVPASTGQEYKGPCSNHSVCDPGLFCTPWDRVPDCSDASSGCCTPYCNLDSPTCPDEALGMTCVPAFVAGAAPPGFEHVGVCALP